MIPARKPRLLACRKAVTAFEYALIASVIALAIVANLTVIGGILSNTFMRLVPYVSK